MRSERPPAGGRGRARNRPLSPTAPCPGLPALGPPVAAEPHGLTVAPARRSTTFLDVPEGRDHRAVGWATGVPGGASAGEPGLLADQGGRGTDHDSRREAGARGGADLPHSRGAQAGPDGPVRSELPATEVDGVRLDHDDLRLLALLAEGLPINSVSRRVAMSDRTIRRRVRAICEQLGLKATVQAIVWAARRGLI